MEVHDNKSRIEGAGFLVFLGLISLALIYVSWPFVWAFLWAVVAAIMFQPLYHRFLVRMRNHTNMAAIGTLLVITFAVVLPAIAIGTIVVDQAAQLYMALESQELDAATYFTMIHDGLPTRLREMLDANGYGDFEDIQRRFSLFVTQSIGLIASQAVTIGGGALSFVLSFGVGLYVTYFLLRDGRMMGPAFARMLPMDGEISRELVARFTSIVRATVKGSLVVGLVQGAIGAMTFWIVGVPSIVLLGVLMAISSLIPVVGTALVWGPVAIYLVMTGEVWPGMVVVISGVLIVGMVDNILRPILVGRDTGIPDWVILVTTLGGLGTIGISGIIIGPVIAGLFIASWSILHDYRTAESGMPVDQAQLAE